MTDSFEISAFFTDISAERIYSSWLDSQAHTAMTGSPAEIDPAVGGKFTAWDRYIQGETLVVEPFRRILQVWRTTEFPEDSPASHLEILIEELDGGAQVTLRHAEIPEGQGDDYRQGWDEYYFKPMKRYFSVEQ